ncbi:hypothetical protein EDD18DRAFT_342578 [Armillaria luteobubalina]|uniref:Uncharacterized protein n=1 Tax=Armillaria luteobubalina TaxID=153913 RepID=A0AA39Q1C4_9AGAR|nr:hypothetical protein EDD18DRAFT_342571 [Armillaria luteobubalina]KAK0494447.1 hypothetical protein EDD18DRAFT_342578 [Armillaria luteobubalina]
MVILNITTTTMLAFCDHSRDQISACRHFIRLLQSRQDRCTLHVAAATQFHFSSDITAFHKGPSATTCVGSFALFPMLCPCIPAANTGPVTRGCLPKQMGEQASTFWICNTTGGKRRKWITFFQGLTSGSLSSFSSSSKFSETIGYIFSHVSIRRYLLTALDAHQNLEISVAQRLTKLIDLLSPALIKVIPAHSLRSMSTFSCSLQDISRCRLLSCDVPTPRLTAEPSRRLRTVMESRTSLCLSLLDSPTVAAWWIQKLDWIDSM